MTTRVGKLHKRTIVKDLNGGIISLRDEADGGWIIRDRQVVNPDKWNEYVKKQKDKEEAAKAPTKAKVREDYPEHKSDNPQAQPDRVDKLEKKVEDMDGKLDAILKAIQK